MGRKTKRGVPQTLEGNFTWYRRWWQKVVGLVDGAGDWGCLICKTRQTDLSSAALQKHVGSLRHTFYLHQRDDKADAKLHLEKAVEDAVKKVLASSNFLMPAPVRNSDQRSKSGKTPLHPLPVLSATTGTESFSDTHFLRSHSQSD